MKRIVIICLICFFYSCTNENEICECSYSINETNTGNAQTSRVINYPCDFQVPEPCR